MGTKFKLDFSMEIEGDTADDAVMKAAIFIAVNASSARPMLTIEPQNPFDFPKARNINILDRMCNDIFANGVMIRDVNLSVVPLSAHPAPERIM